MTFKIGTDYAKIELTVATLPALKVHQIPEQNGEGEIPPNLANATMLLIDLHKANGDLAWIADMVHDAEFGQRPASPVQRHDERYVNLLGHLTSNAAKEVLEAFQDTVNPDNMNQDEQDIHTDLLRIINGR